MHRILFFLQVHFLLPPVLQPHVKAHDKLWALVQLSLVLELYYSFQLASIVILENPGGEASLCLFYSIPAPDTGCELNGNVRHCW